MGQWENRLETHHHDTPNTVPGGTAVGSTWRCSCGRLFRFTGMSGVQWDMYATWEPVIEQRYGSDRISSIAQQRDGVNGNNYRD